MEARDKKSPHTLFWIAGIAVTVFSAVGVAAVMGWIPTSTSSSPEKIVAVEPGKPAQPAKRVRDPDRVVARGEAAERARDEFRADARQDAKEHAQAPCADCGVIESVRQIEKSTQGYEITVRLENGSSRVIHEANAPSWRIGDRVKVVNGVLQSNA